MIVAAIAVAGCTGGGDSSSPEPAASADTSTAGAGGGAEQQTAESAEPSDSAATPKQHFASDFAPACRGNAVDGATPYDPAATGAHKVVFLKGTSINELSEAYLTVPEEWKILFNADTDEYAKGELAACIVQTEATLAQECDGYEDNGVVLDVVVKHYSVTYDVSVHEAVTGKQLGTTTITAEAGDCPLYVSFTEGEKETDWYEAGDTAIADFLAPFAQT